MDIHAYLKEHIEELTKIKAAALVEIQSTGSTVDELDPNEKKELTEKKMEFFMLSGALAALNELQKAIEQSEKQS